MAMIDTGLGWSADESDLVYEAGTFLGTTYQPGWPQRSYTKTSDGYALCYGYKHWEGIHPNAPYWWGICMVSTVADNTRMTVTNDNVRRLFNFTINGVVWYVSSQGMHGSDSMGTAETFEINTPFKYMDMTGETIQSGLEKILRDAKVISSAIDINDPNISVQLNPESFIYDGTAKEPTVTAVYMDTSTVPPTPRNLVQGTDFTVAYQDNIEMTLSAKAIITGIGEFTGTKTLTFSIVSSAFDIASTRVTLPDYYFTYTGSNITPRPLVEKYVGVSPLGHWETLTLGTDYALYYQNNVNVGTATIEVRGIGLYAGSKYLNFYITKSDPFTPGGTSGDGGGDGDEDYSTSTVAPGNLPSISAADTGLTRIYIPTVEQIRSLANYLWRQDSTWDTIVAHIKQYFDNVMEAIIGFSLIPVSHELIGRIGPTNLRILIFDTGVPLYAAANQYVTVDCGACDVTTQIGSFLDYSPYTSVELFLPFIGSVQLDTDEVMGKQLHVKYNIDIVTGSCAAIVLVDNNVMYQFSGQCSIVVPITQANFSQYISAAIGVAGTAVGAMVGGAIAASSGGLAEALTAHSVQQRTNVGGESHTETVIRQRNQSTGRLNTQTSISRDTSVSPMSETTQRSYTPSKATQASYLGLSPTNVSNTVSSVIGSKPSVQHSGSFSGNSGYLGVRKCFLTIKRPKQALPTGYNQVNGYPCMQWLRLGDLSGFTQVQQIQLTGIPATNPELDELLSLLKSGVVL